MQDIDELFKTVEHTEVWFEGLQVSFRVSCSFGSFRVCEGVVGARVVLAGPCTDLWAVGFSAVIEGVRLVLALLIGWMEGLSRQLGL